ncbi:helix-turn-helix domain-containing protein [Clostridium sp. UBA7503]|uniref:helix-turn-helix domain-containing protein n=1 Tax=Clostridium sp. UBA7503 TaxID=1946377 RepID=UPI003217E7FA
MVRKGKVSAQEKITSVQDYLSGKYLLQHIADRYQLHRSSIEKWITLYKSFGPE